MAVAKRAERSGTRTPRQGTSYEEDFYTWSREQAGLLREGRLDALDLLNLAEEIEDLGKEQFNKLESAYRVILLHLLKWDHQPERRCRSWVASIRTQRLTAADVLEDSPGLKSRQAEALGRAYRKAKIEAAAATRLGKDKVPPECPYSPDEIMTREFEWPER